MKNNNLWNKIKNIILSFIPEQMQTFKAQRLSFVETKIYWNVSKINDDRWWMTPANFSLLKFKACHSADIA
jgi:hypothetical protein